MHKNKFMSGVEYRFVKDSDLGCGDCALDGHALGCGGFPCSMGVWVKVEHPSSRYTGDGVDYIFVENAYLGCSFCAFSPGCKVPSANDETKHKCYAHKGVEGGIWVKDGINKDEIAALKSYGR